ncbi:hypothetical protein [uncultured Oscillibacter sp.]|uniref:hypothetical protein n=1 Tax=uncultured Oscillibacter sp. TaxID=876091 RepID=UPI00260896E2|nr:hypothetical protein [uncultured Oscillibacter sp.]
MHNYIYELLQAPVPEEEWTKAWEYHEHPDAFPISDIVEDAKDRSAVITRFGAWLKENRLGELDGESFTIDAQVVDCYFEGRFAVFQQAVTALQQLNESQFIHNHDQVQGLIFDLTEIFTQKHGDYVLWNDGLEPTPLEEFLRKAKPGVRYCIGAVLDYKH